MITAKLKLNSKAEHNEGNVGLVFGADYRDDEGNLINQEWAYATPSCSVTMMVNAGVGELFTQGSTYTITFAEEELNRHG